MSKHETVCCDGCGLKRSPLPGVPNDWFVLTAAPADNVRKSVTLDLCPRCMPGLVEKSIRLRTPPLPIELEKVVTNGSTTIGFVTRHPA